MNMVTKAYAYAAIFTAFLIFASGQSEEVNVTFVEQVNFLGTYAEKWAFNHIIQVNIPEYLEPVQAHVRDLLKKYTDDVPKFEEEISIKVPDERIIYFNLTLGKGEFSAGTLPKLQLNEIMGYEGLEIQYSVEFLWENITIKHDFQILKNGTGYKGEVCIFSSGLRYKFKMRQRLGKETPSIENIISRCPGEITTAVTGIPSVRKLVTKEIQAAVTHHYKEIVTGDIEALTRMAIADAISRSDFKPYFPKYFKMDHLPSGMERELKKSKCKSQLAQSRKAERTGSEENISEDYINLPFTKNEVERRMFVVKMREGIEIYTDDIVSQAMKELADRGLINIQIKGFMTEFSINAPTGKAMTGKISYGNGHITGGSDFIVEKIIHLICSHDRCKVSWKITLPHKLEFVHYYSIQMENQLLKGKTTVWPGQLAFTIQMELNLKEKSSKLIQFDEECYGELLIQINEETEIHRMILKSIQEEISVVVSKNLEDVKVLLTQVFNHTISTIKLSGYLPHWNYEREFIDKSNQTGQNFSEKISFCTLEELIYSEDKEFGELAPPLIEYDHMFPFITNAYHQRAFVSLLLPELDKYIMAILNEANNIILLRGLTKFEMPEKQRYPPTKDEMETVEFLNCSVDNISPFLKQKMFLDEALYHNNYLELQFKSPLWRNLKVRCGYTANVQGRILNGFIDSDWQDVNYDIIIRIKESTDSTMWSLGEAELEKFKLACVGNLTTQSTPSGNDIADEKIKITFNTTTVEGLKLSEDLLIHAFEDAILSVNPSEYIPPWNYKKIPGLAEKTRTEMPVFAKCSELAPDDPVFAHKKQGSPGIVPSAVKGNGLSDYFRRNIDLWINSISDQIFTPAHQKIDDIFLNNVMMRQFFNEEHNITVASKSSKNLKIILEKRTIEGMAGWNVKRHSTIGHANGNDITFIVTEKLSVVNVIHDIAIFTPNDTSLSMETLTGEVQMRLSNFTTSFKLRLDVTNEIVKFERMVSVCAQDVTLVKDCVGNISDEEKTLKVATGGIWRIVQEDVIMSILEVLAKTVEDVASNIKYSRWDLPHWLWAGQTKMISDIGLRLELLEGATEFPRMDLCRQKLSKTANKSSSHNGNIPVANEDADWRLLRRCLREASNTVNEFTSYSMLDLPYLGRLRIQKHLWTSTLNDSITFSVHKGYVEVPPLVIPTTSEEYAFDENGITFETRLQFQSPIKFQVEGEGNLPGAKRIDLIQGSLASLMYVYHVHFDRKTEEVHLEDISLDCIGDVSTEVDGVTPGDGIAEYLNEFTKKIVAGPVLNYIEDLLFRYLAVGFNDLNGHPQVNSLFPRWNYDKVFHPLPVNDNICS